MKVPDRINRILDHFVGIKPLGYLVLCLYAAGIIVFIINCIYIFPVYENREDYLLTRMIMKVLIDLPWVAAAALGAKYYPTKRNRMIIPALILFMVGDVGTLISLPLGGIFYTAGHIFMLIAIVETTYIRKWQKVVLAAGIAVAVLLPLVVLDNWLFSFAATAYGIIVTTVMAFSLSNRFFWLAGIIFYLSDVTGIIRVSLMDRNHTYIITTLIYYISFFMLCVSVYSTNRKEVVTVSDLLRMINDSKSEGVSFWVCGKWALGLIRGDRKYSYDHIDIAYDIDQADEFRGWIAHAGYERKHRYAKGIRSYYSEKFGELKIFPCLFRQDGSAMLTNEKGHQLDLDEGFFEEISVFGRKIPCIAPGGQELINDAASDDR